MQHIEIILKNNRLTIHSLDYSEKIHLSMYYSVIPNGILKPYHFFAICPNQTGQKGGCMKAIMTVWMGVSFKREKGFLDINMNGLGFGLS